MIMMMTISQAQAVQRQDDAIHQINCYLADEFTKQATVSMGQRFMQSIQYNVALTTFRATKFGQKCNFDVLKFIIL